PMNITRREFVAAAAAGSAAVVGRSLLASESAPAGAKPAASAITAKSWPLFRGDSLAQGFSPSSLPAKPEVLWKHTVQGGAFDGTPVIDGGIVYVGDMDGKVYALKLDTGDEVWTYKVESGFIAAPAVRGNLLYIGDIDGKFYALDCKNGQPKWTFQADAEIDSGANFWKGNVLFGSQDAHLYCLNAEGKLVWKFQIQDQIRCMPTIVGDCSFVAGCDSMLHIIDLNEGKETASVPIDAPTGVTPAVLGDNVFFGTEAGVFFAIDWKEARVSWKKEDSNGSQSIRSSPAVQPGIVVVGSRNRSVQAFDPATGKELWTFASKQRIDSSPVIVGNRVLVGAADGRLYALDIKTGQPTWEYQATGGFSGSPAIADGKLVIASDRGVVYCFGKKS
ncbi:MAG TPA: PQQ-binding-like beta-propeller repeat protein, partial [Pirellulaceae bacterium]|nr:PQQ-binding-like beta-propeller repeat protein [Pirellulaceae bacterium]